MNKIIFFRPQTQYENMGDLVINQQLLKKILETGVKVEINLISENVPDWFISKLTKDIKIDSFLSNKFQYYKKLASSILSKKTVFIFEPPGHHFHNDDIKKVKRWYLKQRIIHLLGAEYVRIGVSIGPYSEDVLPIELKKSKLYKFTGVRELYSMEYLKSIDIVNFAYCPDLGACLPFLKKNQNNQENICLYEFRTSPLSTSMTDIDGNSNIIDVLLKLKEKYILKPVLQVELDRDYITYLEKNIDSRNDPVSFIHDGQESIYAEYAKAKLVVSNRLHVLLFALSQGTMVIPVINRKLHFKVAGVFEDMGLGDVIFDTNSDSNIINHIGDVENFFYQYDVEKKFKENSDTVKKVISDILNNNV